MTTQLIELIDLYRDMNVGEGTSKARAALVAGIEALQAEVERLKQVEEENKGLASLLFIARAESDALSAEIERLEDAWLDAENECKKLRAELDALKAEPKSPATLQRYEPEIWREWIRMEPDSQGDWVRFSDVAVLAAPQAPAPQWQPIETAPNDGRKMFVVQGFNVTNLSVNARNYTTDPYCVWRGDGGEFVRWPHPFHPTHWMPLPPAP